MMGENYRNLNYNIETVEYGDQITYETWSNIVYEAVIENLERFTDEDWDQLFSELPRKSVLWKRRLCDCLWLPDPRCVKALLCLSDTQDEETFYMMIVNLLDLEEFIDPEDMKPLCKINTKWLPPTSRANIVFREFLERYGRSSGTPDKQIP